MKDFSNNKHTKKKTNTKYKFLDGMILVTLFSLWYILIFVTVISALYVLLSPIYYTIKYLILVFNNVKIDMCIFVFDIMMKPILSYAIALITAYVAKHIRAYMIKKY